MKAFGITRPRDRYLQSVVALAGVLSLAAWVYYYQRSQTTSYPDSLSHLLISRRVLLSPTPGLAQLGGVWLPLPHLLALPLVWNNALFYSGLAGSAVSMAAYLVTVIFLYRIGLALTSNRLAAVVTALVFAVNQNALYMQSTPMTEMLLFACLAAAVFWLLRWGQSGRGWHLVGAAAAMLLATLTRYEGWWFLLAVLGVIFYTAARRKFSYRKTEGLTILFSLLAFFGVGVWLVWNQAIFGNAAYFQNGDYAKPSLWVSAGERAVGNLGLAAQTYGIACAEILGTTTVIVAVMGLVLFLGKEKLRPGSISPLALLAFVPFYVWALYAGQRPLHVRQITGDLYNTRFGLVMLLPAAIFAGYLVSIVSVTKRRILPMVVATLIGGAVVGSSTAAFASNNILTLNENEIWQQGPTAAHDQVTADWLKSHYDGGLVLMEGFGNETVLFYSQLPTERVVYEGSYLVWQLALQRPFEEGINWIYMRQTPTTPDKVFAALHDSSELSHYDLVFRDSDRLIYTLKGPKTATRLDPMRLMSDPTTTPETP